MWLVSAFCHLSSAVSGVSALSLASHVVPRISQNQLRRLASRTVSFSAKQYRQSLTPRAAMSTSSGGRADAKSGGDGIPEDVESLLHGLYNMSFPPRVCLSTTGCRLSASVSTGLVGMLENSLLGDFFRCLGFMSLTCPRSGGQAISWMLGVPGASACLLEASVPYSTSACDERIGGEPVNGSYCTPAVAESLAKNAYARAVSLCVSGSDQGPHALSEAGVIGVGCTAAVASSRPKKGLHRCFLCTQTHDGVTHYELELAKGRRDRAGEDAAVSRVILQATAESSGLAVPNDFKNDHLIKDISPSSEGAVTAEISPEAMPLPEPDAIEALVEGRSSAILVIPKLRCGKNYKEAAYASRGADATLEQSGTKAKEETAIAVREAAAKAALSRGTTVVLPGSYNPLHRGHLRLLEAARALHADTCKRLASEHSRGSVRGSASPPKDVPVHAVFEISVANADKGGLTAEEVRKRALQFSDPESVGWPVPVVLTRAPLFSQKARLFPGCAFVVGADTAKRIVDTKYYGNSQVEMVAALSEIRYLGCSFIVGGRKGADGGFETLEDVLEGKGLPDSVRCMFHGLDEETFREDLSSTSIRAGNAKTGL